MTAERQVSLDIEVEKFISTDDQVALGNLAIRKAFSDRVVMLFAISNLFVLIGLGAIFWLDCLQVAARQIKPSERIVSSQVIMALLGATTVQLGMVVLTIARAIFPSDEKSPSRLKRGFAKSLKSNLHEPDRGEHP